MGGDSGGSQLSVSAVPAEPERELGVCLSCRVAGKVTFQYLKAAFLKSYRNQGLPGSLVVKNLPSNAGAVGLILVWELRFYMSPDQNRNNTLTNSIKDFKNSPH